MLLVDWIETFISDLPLNGEVKNAVVNSGQTTITIANPFYLRAGLNIYLDDVAYPVVSITKNGCDYDVVITGEIENPVLYKVNSPFYFHGTPYATGASISHLDDDSKVPMIYLYELIKETIFDSESSIEKEAPISLFFLDVADYVTWTTDQHYEGVINPQRRLVDFFIKTLDNYKGVGIIDSFEIFTHVKFGVFQKDKGHNNSIFNERLSGIELRFTLPLKKCNDC